MFQRVFSILGWSRKEDRGASLPFYLFLTLLVAAMSAVILRSETILQGAGQRVLFTVLVLVHLALHWSSARVAHAANQASRWFPLVAYCMVQGALIFGITLLTSHLPLFMGLYAVLVVGTLGMLWHNRRAITVAAAFYVALLALNFAAVWSLQQLVITLPAIAGTLAFSLLYVVLYGRQVQAREDAQALLEELEVAHGRLQAYAKQVEELSISQERQRMARELHDTLAQGLVGLILQLEAADSHLESGSPDRAETVVQQALQRAKMTLSEARRAIQDLRPNVLEQETLVDALGREVESFAAATDIRTTFEVDAGPWNAEPEMAGDILRIVQEALSNVARHAGANHVLIRLARHDSKLRVVVQDDGAGFVVQEGLGRQGCFGLAGMRERAERLGGVLHVTGEPGAGTKVALELGE